MSSTIRHQLRDMNQPFGMFAGQKKDTSRGGNWWIISGSAFDPYLQESLSGQNSESFVLQRSRHDILNKR
jgi:hypothetical protein